MLCTELINIRGNRLTIYERVAYSWNFGYLKAATAWTVWLFAGTIFYAFRNGFGLMKGFYMVRNRHVPER